jgi:hypothetical protein
MDRLVGIVGALTTMESWPNKIQQCPNRTPRARAQVRTQAYRKWLILGSQAKFKLPPIPSFSEAKLWREPIRCLYNRELATHSQRQRT